MSLMKVAILVAVVCVLAHARTLNEKVRNRRAIPGCGYTLYGRSGFFQLVSDGSEYSNNMECSLTIRSPENIFSTTINFSEFNVEDQSSCNYDALTIRDGYTVLDKLCGDRGDFEKTYFSQSGALTLTFTSDYSVVRSGFAFTYETEPIGGAAGPFYPTNSSLFQTNSTFFPTNSTFFPTNSTFFPTNSTYFPTNSTYFPTNSTYFPTNSTYFPTNSTYFPTNSTYFPTNSTYFPTNSTYFPTNSTYFPTNSTYFPTNSTYFPTNSTYFPTNSTYFPTNSTYFPTNSTFFPTNSTYIQNDSSDENTDGGCNYVSRDMSGSYRLQNGQGDRYANNLECRIILQSPVDSILKIDFSYFNVEYQSNCNYDSLTVQYQGRQTAKLCGDTIPNLPQYYISGNNPAGGLIMTFTSDYSVGKDGFGFDYEFIPLRQN